MSGVCVYLQDLSVHNSPLPTAEAPMGSWANSVLDLKNSQSDQLVNGLLDQIRQETVDAINADQRQMNRQEAIFGLYPQQPEVSIWII